MIKPRPFTFAFLLGGLTIFSLFIGCTKDHDDPPVETPVCDIRGTYTGTYTNQFNQSATSTYILKEDGFAVSSGLLTDPINAGGSYVNTCDSVKMNYWNSINNSYYYFEGALSVKKDTISGIYRNLTSTSEVGTFLIVKE